MSDVAISVFSNPVIWDNLSSYLGYKEFINLRLVSKLFLNQTAQSVRWKKGACLKLYWNCGNIDKEGWVHPTEILCPSDLQESSLPTTNLKIMITFQNKVQADYSSISLESLLSGVTGLKLTTLGQDGDPPEASRQLAVKSASAYLLNFCTKLKYFAANEALMNLMPFDTFPEVGREQFHTLEELVIYSSPGENYFWSNKDQLQKNLITFATLLTKLQKLVVTKGIIPADLVQHVGVIVINNCSTLKHLELLEVKLWNAFEATVTTGFPNLKTLKLRAESSRGEAIALFLNLLEPLEILELTFKDRLPIVVYEALGRKCQKIHTLHVKSKGLATGGPGVHWEFLASATLLQDLTIKMPYNISRFPLEPIGNYMELLSHVGPNLRKLHLRGLPGNGPVDWSTINFPLLEELRMLRCEGSFTDSTLQYLSAPEGNGYPFPLLEVLEFSHCDGITNTGITGVTRVGKGRAARNISVGHSLNNRTRLRQLTIKDCYNVTDGALNRLSFQELKYLDISSNSKVTRPGIMKAIRQNPKLEVLRSSWRMGREIEEAFGSSRFIRLLFVNDISGVRSNDSDSEADQLDYDFSDADFNHGMYYDSDDHGGNDYYGGYSD